MASSASEVRPVSRDELERFTRQLGVLLSAHVDMLRALDVAAQQSGSARLAAVGRSIAAAMADGREFHTALARHPDLFSSFYVQMARQGEADGVLGAALLTVADYLAREPGFTAPAPAAGAAPAAVAAPIPSRLAGRLVAVPMLSIAVAALGSGVLLAGEFLFGLPPDWAGPLAVAWSGVCLGFGGWLALRAGERSSAERCSLCGRGERQAGPLTRGPGISICDACLRSHVGQLKPPEPPTVAPAPPTAVPEAVASEPKPAPAAPYAGSAPSTNGKHPTEGIVKPSEKKEKRFEL
jgi:hypothetical protein